MSTPSEIDLAWAAGMIDADGCITLQRTSAQSRWGKPMIVVDNTDREVIDEMVRLFGGSVVAKKRYQDHHRQAWSWRRHGALQVASDLKLVLPFMRCQMKKERARMIVEEYPRVTLRNGQYRGEALGLKQDWEDRFMALGEGRGSRSLAS